MHDTTIREKTRAHGIVKSIQRSRVTLICITNALPEYFP